MGQLDGVVVKLKSSHTDGPREAQLRFTQHPGPVQFSVEQGRNIFHQLVEMSGQVQVPPIRRLSVSFFSSSSDQKDGARSHVIKNNLIRLHNPGRHCPALLARLHARLDDVAERQTSSRRPDSPLSLTVNSARFCGENAGYQEFLRAQKLPRGPDHPENGGKGGMFNLL